MSVFTVLFFHRPTRTRGLRRPTTQPSPAPRERSTSMSGPRPARAARREGRAVQPVLRAVYGANDSTGVHPECASSKLMAIPSATNPTTKRITTRFRFTLVGFCSR
jgi:hypothetical protein